MKKLLISCLIGASLFSGTAYAATLYRTTVTDSTSGRSIDYFDFGSDGAERQYFTQSCWTSDSKNFVVSDMAESKVYLYNIDTHTIEPVYDEAIKCNDVGITSDDVMYLRNQCEWTNEDPPYLYKIDLKQPKIYDKKTLLCEVSAEINADGTAFVGDVLPSIKNDLSRWTAQECYDRRIAFSGNTGKSKIDGSHYSYNIEHNDVSSGKTYRRWRNSWYFDIPDNFIYGTSYEELQIDVEYYVPNYESGVSLKLFTNADKKQYSSSIVGGKWATATFTISGEDSNPSSFNDQNKWEKDWNVNWSNSPNWYDEDDDRYSDFRIFTQGGTSDAGCEIYIRKVTVKNYSIETITREPICLGVRPSGYQIHLTNDGKAMSITGDEGDDIIEVCDLENYKWEVTKKSFPSPNTVANHVMINPVYSNLVLFAHEGDAKTVFDRIWIYDRTKGTYFNAFKQYNNLAGTYTGEAVGHESWTADGEYIVAVKYKESPNVGKNGIIRVDKYGENREYINNDYDYWHCQPSPDGRWIVADTKLESNKTKIVLIDSKTGKSYVVANQKAGSSDPYQPHPQFSRDGKKVSFTMMTSRGYLGVGIVDVSYLVDKQSDDDIAYASTNKGLGFRLSPFTVNFTGGVNNTVSTTVDNLDGYTKDFALYTAVYDSNGKLISVGKTEKSSDADTTIQGNFSWSEDSKTLKCLLWDGELKPIQTTETQVQKLRVAKKGADFVILSWQPSGNLIDSAYEVYRNGTKIGTTTELIYRDTGLTAGTSYTYQVKPIYNNSGYVTSDDSCVTITPVKSGGSWSLPTNTNPTGAGAKVIISTNSGTGSSLSSNQYVEWNKNTSNGITIVSGGYYNGDDRCINNSSTYLTFKIDDSYMYGSNMNMAWVDITYKDYGSSNIYLEYNAADSTSSNSANKRAETIIKCTGTNQYLTKRIPIIDANFSGQGSGGSDFRIGASGVALINNIKVIGY